MDLRKRATPQAFAVQTPTGDEAWTEFEGSWSTFNLQVGSDSLGSESGGQHFRFIPSTSSITTWLAKPDNCDETNVLSKNSAPGRPVDQKACSKARGVGEYIGSQSSGYVWNDSNTADPEHQMGGNDLGIDSNPATLFGSAWNATNQFGYDFLYLETGSGEKNSSNRVPIFEDSNLQFYMPTVGLGVGDTVFGDTSTSSLVESMANKSVIPSRSWGYTAGASYKSYKGSLVLGGYDEARIEPDSTQSFKFQPGDDQTELLVQVSSINFVWNGSVGPTGQGPAAITEEFDAIIDSTLPYFFLPQTVCDKFRSNLNLDVNEGAPTLYTVSTRNLSTNAARTSAIEFKFHDKANTTVEQTISLPYDAFNVTASWVWGFRETTHLFPIIPMNSNKAVLGRPFFQAAYVSANYEANDNSRGFNVSKARFPETSTSSIKSIIAPSSGTEEHGNRALSGGAIGGIVGGIVGGVLAAGLFLWFCYIKPRRQKKKGEQEHARDKELTTFPDYNEGNRDRVDSTWSNSAATEVPGDIPSPSMSSTGGWGWQSRPGHSRKISGISELSTDSETERGPRSGPLDNIAEAEDKTDAATLDMYNQRAKRAEGSAGGTPQHSPQPASSPRAELEGSRDWIYP